MKTIIAFIILLALGMWWVAYTDKQDMKLMELCANHQTRTLYECNK